jgi:hypothetical protein
LNGIAIVTRAALVSHQLRSGRRATPLVAALT